MSLEFINFIDFLDSEDREEAHQSGDLKGNNSRFSSPSSRKDTETIDQWHDAYMVYVFGFVRSGSITSNWYMGIFQMHTK